jgi:hypothetical protein
MKLLFIFIVFNILNVVIQTVKSIATIKCGKTMAAIINAVAYGLYTYIVILMVCELPLWSKCLIVGLCNLVGVYVVKWFEEKARKDKLWKIEATVKGVDAYDELCENKISCNCLCTNTHNEFIINCFCPTQKESVIVKNILTKYNAKYFVSETKIL